MLITADEYIERGYEGGEDLAAVDAAIFRAEQLIDLVTDGKAGSPDGLSAVKTETLKNAVCLQAEQILTSTPRGERVTVGDFSEERFMSPQLVNAFALSMLRLGGLVGGSVAV